MARIPLIQIEITLNFLKENGFVKLLVTLHHDKSTAEIKVKVPGAPISGI